MARGKLVGGFLIAGIVVLSVVGFAFRDRIRAHYYLSKVQKPDTNHFYWLRRLAETGPAGVSLILDTTKEGSYDGDVEQTVGYILRLYARCDPYPYVSALLGDPDPRVRGFAALVTGHTGDRRYLPFLEGLAHDDSALPEGWFDKTVAERARYAINWIREDRPASDPDDFREMIQRLASEP